MSTKDTAVDAYIARAQPFARPILKHIRRVVHRGCPDVQEEAMGQFGRITSLKDLPSEATLVQLVRFAKKLNDDGVKPPKRQVTPVKDRVDWVVEAKTEVTRDRRVATSVERMAQGNARNWKYENC